ncbi:tRNA (cytidine(34)-2'-O)-methyltransferase [Engelhardtia mirabilis]|uniref:Putative tRNA (cytidine(34)-2'-O)-methyltransferase n=1 Tax=Engelhardtia mirabilis TaxID=2528011 RepID=A0A518BQA4_9BACT|nr:tRNA (cytidine(34)-2'-O)-methyltransferase [Planctomycetes bacterium Pla133]QDV03476.1 tRNA (cytidine(34)-2'-O)-methyltransferase [Planctomycetes bacterium Pla86]
MDLVLLHPEIPHNTGCAARLAAATGVPLHLVEPLGFSLEDRYLKRAGLDYWPQVDLRVHADWAAARSALEQGAQRPLEQRLRLFTARGGQSLFQAAFRPDDVLVLGCESRGLPAALLAEHPQAHIYIPIRPGVRSLNLANVAALALYTALDRSGVGLPENDGRYEADPREQEDLRAADVVRASGPRGPGGGA